jgi:hypothetical protein
MRRVMDPTEHLAPICNRRKAAQICSTSGRIFSGAVRCGESRALSKTIFRSLLTRTSCVIMASVRQLGSSGKNLLESLLCVILLGGFAACRPERFSL